MVVANPIPIFVINLDRDPERLDYMRREFARVGLSFERLPGIYGTDLPLALQSYFCDSEGTVISPLRVGEIGCYASHLTAWNYIVDRDLTSGALVCEDDIKLPDAMPRLLERLIAQAPPGWDIIRLSSYTKKSISPVARLCGGYRLVRYWKISVLAGAYLISRSGAEKMLRPGLRTNPIDVDISRPWLFGIDSYGVVPTPISQNTEQSTIDTMEDRQHARRNRTRLRRLRDKTRSLPTKVRRGVYNLKSMGPADWLACLVQNARHKITGRRFDWSSKMRD
ncbi:MAG: glycosyltransferase family 25 protein [Deltaproteobacteria bacterium]|nr:glycosyltransferase family 25 protein [Candidatus Zymogenaceae bacterium]